MQRKQRPDMTATANNPKIDTKLLSEFHRLTEEYERLSRSFKGCGPGLHKAQIII